MGIKLIISVRVMNFPSLQRFNHAFTFCPILFRGHYSGSDGLKIGTDGYLSHMVIHIAAKLAV